LELNEQAFDGFFKVLSDAAVSLTDYIHYIFNGVDIVVYRNTTGKFKKPNLNFNKEYESITAKPSSKDALFEFPFSLARSHFMILAQRLEFFFLPFHVNTPMGDHIRKNYAQNDTLEFSESDFKRIAKPEGSSGWLSDRCVDFMTRW
jgi:hypothetical protein